MHIHGNMDAKVVSWAKLTEICLKILKVMGLIRESFNTGSAHEQALTFFLLRQNPVNLSMME